MESNVDRHEITSRLLSLDTGLVSDVLDEAGLPDQALANSVKAMAGPEKLAGPIVCVRGAPRVSSRNSVSPLPSEALEDNIEVGSVMILASGGMISAAPIGGIISQSLQSRGCRGIVTDAAIRDLAEIDELGLPVFAAGTSPANAARIWQFIETGTPLVLRSALGGNLIVHPGDFALGDKEGVVIIPAAAVLQIVEDAEALRELENQIVAGMSAGLTRKQALEKFPRFKHVRPVKTKR
jgi:regulator of RNase E activity RraA